MFATISRSGRILRSVFFAGGRSSYDWSYAWINNDWRRSTCGSHKRSIVWSIVAPDDPSYDQSWNSAADSVGCRMGSALNPRNFSTFYSVSGQSIGGATRRKVARPVARLIVRPLRFGIVGFKFWTWPSTLLRLICPLRSPTTFATSRTTSATSRTLFLRFAHDSNICRSQVGRNLVVSPVWPSFEYDHNLAASDFALAITHGLCDQSYVLSTTCPRCQHCSVACRSSLVVSPVWLIDNVTLTRTDIALCQWQSLCHCQSRGQATACHYCTVYTCLLIFPFLVHESWFITKLYTLDSEVKYKSAEKHTANITASNVTIRRSVPQIPICSMDYTSPILFWFGPWSWAEIV